MLVEWLGVLDQMVRQRAVLDLTRWEDSHVPSYRAAGRPSSAESQVPLRSQELCS